MKKPVLAAFGGILVLTAGALWFWFARAPAPPPEPLPPPPPPAETTGSAPIAHPLPAAAAPLPALADSDPAMGSALSQLIGAAAFRQFIRPENLIRHIVVTIDNLAKPKLAVELRPVVATRGSFQADGDETRATISPGNAARYEPALAVLRRLDNAQLVALYLQYYPLFQNAYQDLGYPNGYFNDRLIAVIDDMLQAPSPPQPVALIRPKVMYEYADPDLESRSAGQKLLMRMSAAQAAEVKARLRTLRAALIAAAPAGAAAAAAP